MLSFNAPTVSVSVPSNWKVALLLTHSQGAISSTGIYRASTCQAVDGFIAAVEIQRATCVHYDIPDIVDGAATGELQDTGVNSSSTFVGVSCLRG